MWSVHYTLQRTEEVESVCGLGFHVRAGPELCVCPGSGLPVWSRSGLNLMAWSGFTLSGIRVQPGTKIRPWSEVRNWSPGTKPLSQPGASRRQQALGRGWRVALPTLVPFPLGSLPFL